MKVSAILASPRKKGVTNTLASAFMKQLADQGADTRSFYLNDMTFKGCQGCMGCKEREGDCVLTDDLTPALKSMQESDVLVFATPIYFWEVTGQFKLFLDRTWSLVKPDYETNPNPTHIEKGKKALLITSQGALEEQHKEVPRKYAGFLTMYGYEVQTLRAFGMGEKGDNDIRPYLARAEEIARKMAG